MIQVSIKEIGDTKKFIKRLEKMRTVSFADLGEIVRKKLIETIDANRKREIKVASERYQGKYATHIKQVITATVEKDGSVGIGNIDELDEKTPYWLILNNGGYTPPTTHGWFSGGNPQGGEGGDSSFTYSSKGPLMKPAKPIEGIHYIEITRAWVDENLGKFVQKAFEDSMK